MLVSWSQLLVEPGYCPKEGSLIVLPTRKMIEFLYQLDRDGEYR